MVAALVLGIAIPGAGAVAQPASASLRVDVVDTAGAPIPHADVVLRALRVATRTHASGRAELDSLRPGATLLAVRRRGYVPDTQTLVLRAGQRTTVTVTLESAAALMDTLIADAQALRDKMADFEKRRAMGIGLFVTRALIEERRPIALRDLLRTLPEVAVLNPGIKFMRTAGSDCLPEYYVDGAPVRSISVDDFTPNEIEGIELYRGPSEVPAHLLSRRSACGLVMIWTRSPSRAAVEPN